MPLRWPACRLPALKMIPPADLVAIERALAEVNLTRRVLMNWTGPAVVIGSHAVGGCQKVTRPVVFVTVNCPSD